MKLLQWTLLAAVLAAACCATTHANDLADLWKFLEVNFGFASPDFSPMPWPTEGTELLKQGYEHDEGLFHHSFTKTHTTTDGEAVERQVVVPYPDERLLNWRVLRDALLLGSERLERLRSETVGDDEVLSQLKEKVMGYFDFMPRQLATIPVDKSVVTFASPCYREYRAWFAEIDPTGGVLNVTVNQSEPYRADCVGIDRELLSFASSLGYPKVHLVTPHGGVASFHIVLVSWAKDEYAFLQQSGMHVSVWPLGVAGTVLSAINTTELFVGGDVAALEARNAGFMGERVNYTMRRRAHPDLFIQPDESEVRSGDILHVMRLDGLDPLIGWGTGGHTGHDTMILELDGVLHVVESTAANPFGRVYWPPPYGVIATEYNQWFKQARGAAYNLVLSRLSDQLSTKFSENVDQAVAFFNATRGSPYGFHNFIFSFFDTAWYNLPFPVTPYLFHAAANLADRLADNRGATMSIYSLLTQGLNHRLNVTCLTMECVNEELLRRGMTFADAAAAPEQDEYRYDGQHSMVCDVFIFSMLKAAGVVLPSIQATEQTPKDLYQVDIYNKTTDWFPAACAASPDYDKATPYCQLMGDYTLTLDNFSTIAQYPMMNEHCYSDAFQSYWRGPHPITC